MFGKGPADLPGGNMEEDEASDFTEQDVRFTVKDGALYTVLMLWPKSTLRIASLGRRALGGASIAKAEVVGGGKLAWKQEDDALGLTLPPAQTGQVVRSSGCTGGREDVGVGEEVGRTWRVRGAG